jgi:DNA polymerase III subunit delta'
MWTVKGFEQQKEFFENIVRSGPAAAGLAHAYLFSGQEMIGKKMFARDLFTMANRHARFANHNPDFLELAPHVAEGEASIYIEDIRDLKKFLSLKIFQGPYRFVIIDDAHRMTTEASNSLLKALEEPSAMTVFILVTSQPEQLPQTISSRCQDISFLPHPKKAIEQCLAQCDLSKSDREFIANMAGGRLGWALTMAKPDNFKVLKKATNDFILLLKKPLTDRMQYAKTLCEKEQHCQYVTLWLSWAYSHKNDLPNAPRILSSLLALSHYVVQPQYNHRLLLENTLINL